MNGASFPREYPPPWGGRGVYPGLCVHMLTILHRPADMYDLRRLPGLAHASDVELVAALDQLEQAGRVRRAVAAVHFGVGCSHPARDVTVWMLTESEGGGR
jgi:hypothetical protein